MLPQAMLVALGRRCNRVTEVTYRSQQLASPDGNQKVYVEGLLRKTVHADSPLRQSDTDSYCYPDSRETINRQLIIETADGTRRLNDRPYNGAYILYHPRSFSSDGRFLALDMQVAYTGGDPGSYVLFLDLEGDRVVQVPNVCQNLVFERYAGFVSATEAVVLCQDYGGPSQQFELVNLLDGSVRRLSRSPENLEGHGSITHDFEVTKTQIFE